MQLSDGCVRRVCTGHAAFADGSTGNAGTCQSATIVLSAFSRAWSSRHIGRSLARNGEVESRISPDWVLRSLAGAQECCSREANVCNRRNKLKFRLANASVT